jgi:hypothetical protein
MKRQLMVFILLVVLLSSCARALTPDQAARGSFKRCRAVR